MNKNRLLLLAILLFFLVISSASAGTVRFIDSAHIGNGSLIFYSADDTRITALNTTEIATLGNETYMIRYQPAGFIQTAQETGYSLESILFLIRYFSTLENLVTLLIAVLCAILIILGIRGKL